MLLLAITFLTPSELVLMLTMFLEIMSELMPMPKAFDLTLAYKFETIALAKINFIFFEISLELMLTLAIFFEILSEFAMVRLRLLVTSNVIVLTLDMFLETPKALELTLANKFETPFVLAVINFIFFEISLELVTMLAILDEILAEFNLILSKLFEPARMPELSKISLLVILLEFTMVRVRLS